jgi:hypothetical protein
MQVALPLILAAFPASGAALPTVPAAFSTIPHCRLVDTRLARRTLPAGTEPNKCGLPSDPTLVTALALNATAMNPYAAPATEVSA